MSILHQNPGYGQASLFEPWWQRRVRQWSGKSRRVPGPPIIQTRPSSGFRSAAFPHPQAVRAAPPGRASPGGGGISLPPGGEGAARQELGRGTERREGRGRGRGQKAARGGPAGAAHEPVMKPGSWAPFVPGAPFKKTLPRPLAGRAGTMGGGAVGQAERTLWRGFSSRGAQQGPGRGTRGMRCTRGQEAYVETTKIIKKVSPLQQGANRSGPWVLGRWPKQLLSPPPGGTPRRIFLNATVAHSWPLQLLGNERIFFFLLPLFPPPPPFVFLQAWNDLL